MPLNKKNKLIFSLGMGILNAIVFSGVARAGEGGIAGAASFRMDSNGNVTSVSVATAVGKRTATAAAFNFSGSVGSGLQSKAWAHGTSSSLTINNIGSETINLTEVAEDVSGMSVGQTNTFSTNTVNILTPGAEGSYVIKSP